MRRGSQLMAHQSHPLFICFLGADSTDQRNTF
jgi:hypothetical protein